MNQPFAHPAGEKLLAEVRNLFANKPIFHKRDKPLIFVCGGSTSGRSKKIRRKFLAWAKNRFREVIFVLAENAYNYTHIYDPPETVNLSHFETVIGEIADCIIVFPESAGSFAELGLFSNHKKIRSKTLVVNPVSYVAQDSFVNLGPIATIDQDSFLKPSLPITIARGSYNFSPIRTRLQRVVRGERRKSFSYKPYRSLSLLDKFLVIHELINIFQFISFDDLEICLMRTFDSANRNEMRPILSVLLGMELIRIKDGYYMRSTDKASLLEFEDVSIEDVRLKVLSHYEKNFPAMWQRYLKVKR